MPLNQDTMKVAVLINKIPLLYGLKCWRNSEVKFLCNCWIIHFLFHCHHLPLKSICFFCFQKLGSLFAGLVTPLIHICAVSSYSATLNQACFACKYGKICAVTSFYNCFKRSEDSVV